jgi:hypothetical protein
MKPSALSSSAWAAKGIVAVNAMKSGVKRNAEGTGTSSLDLTVGQFLYLNVRLFYRDTLQPG